MKQTIFTIVAIVGIVTAAIAHEGVKNPAVMERMMAMKAIGAAMKTLGGMAKGQTEFDAAKAQTALTIVAEKAKATPALFEANEDDPKSEAKPAIWTNFADFTAKSEALERAATDAANISSPEELGTALAALGDTCRACHKAYKE